MSPESLLETSSRTGYSEQEIRQYFPAKNLEYREDGLDHSRFKAPPEPYVHPRILFNPGDLPDLRQRVRSTQAGQKAMGTLRRQALALTAGDGAHRATYDALAAGEFPAGIHITTVATHMQYEALRCLIDEDHEAASKLAAATVTFATHAIKAVRKERAGKDPSQFEFRDYQHLAYHTLGQGSIGLIYDWIYNDMTDAQRKAIRRVISEATEDMELFNRRALYGWPANTSNWISLHAAPLVYMALAIEGEDGYHPDTYYGAVEAMKKFLLFGVDECGEPFEGAGKCWIAADSLIPMAKRGDMLIASKNARGYIDDYFFHAMQPWGGLKGGGAFHTCDAWGGTGTYIQKIDAEVMKYAFPDDPQIDFVYRNNIGEQYQRGDKHSTGHHFYTWDLSLRVIVADDYDPIPWPQALERATAGKALDWYNPATGLTIGRSAWDQGALQLVFYPRALPGGHTFADRNHFSIAALGRHWAIYPAMDGKSDEGAAWESRYHNIILVDGKGQGELHTPPGRSVAFESTPGMLTTIGNAKWAYSYQLNPNGNAVTITPNDSRLVKSNDPFMNLPWSDLPNWYDSRRNGESGTPHGNWTPNNPVRYAFRTAMLIRPSITSTGLEQASSDPAANPYVIISDDIRKDDAVHEYTWQMIVPNDLEHDPAVLLPDETAGIAEMVLTDPKDPDRFMLVRVLRANGESGTVGMAMEAFRNPRFSDRVAGKRLTVKIHSVEPQFMLLLYPFRKGDPMPETTWTGNDRLTVSIAGQTDQFEVDSRADGLRRITGRRP